MGIDIVANEVKNNEKRMKKLSTLGRQKRREKARGYVVATAKEQKIHLTEDEIITAAVMVSG